MNKYQYSNNNFSTIFLLLNSKAKNEYRGCGEGVLFVDEHGEPCRLFYADDHGNVALPKKSDVPENWKVYEGIISSWEFCVTPNRVPIEADTPVKASYDYTEFLNEFREELLDKCLKKSSTVYVLRGDSLVSTIQGETIRSSYKPVIDWFYKWSHADANDRPKLEAITVDDLLVEMETWNRIL